MAKLFKFTDLQIGNFVSFKFKKKRFEHKINRKKYPCVEKILVFFFTDTQIY